MKRNTPGISSGGDFDGESGEAGGIHFGNGKHANRRAAFIVKTGDQFSREKYAERTSKPQLAIFESRHSKRIHDDARGPLQRPVHSAIVSLAVQRRYSR